MEKEEMPPSAGGSLVWKADDLYAPSSCQYAPLKQRNTEVGRGNINSACTVKFYPPADRLDISFSSQRNNN